MNPKVSIIIPTRGRSQLLLPRLRLVEKNTPELYSGEAELIWVIDIDDSDTFRVLFGENLEHLKLGVINDRIIAVNKLETPANKWNQACKYAKGEWLVTLSDDSAPTPNWLTNALKTRNYGFLGLPDGVTGDRNRQFTPLYMATREWLKKFNGGVLVIPSYGIWYADIETALRAHNSLTYMVAWESVVTQLHADFGSAQDDDTYAIGRSRRINDLKIFEERKAKDFPNDFDSVL